MEKKVHCLDLRVKNVGFHHIRLKELQGSREAFSQLTQEPRPLAMKVSYAAQDIVALFKQLLDQLCCYESYNKQ